MFVLYYFQAVPVERGLLTSCPYDPRVRKKVPIGQRRPILEIGTNSGKTSGKNSGTKSGTNSGTSVQHSSHHNPQTSTVVQSATCSSSVLRETYEQSLSGPVMHGHQLKNIFTSKPEEHIRITPYQSKFRRNRALVPQSSDISLPKELPFTTVAQSNALTKRLQTGVITNSWPCTASSSFNGPSSQKTFISNVASQTVVAAKSSTMEPLLSCVVNPPLQAVVQSQHLVFTTPLQPPPPPPPQIPSLLLPPPPPFAGTNDSSQTSSVSSVTVASGKSHLHGDNGGLKQQKCVSEKLRQLQG